MGDDVIASIDSVMIRGDSGGGLELLPVRLIVSVSVAVVAPMMFYRTDFES